MCEIGPHIFRVDLRYAFIYSVIRGGSRTAATFKMERFVIIVNSFQLLTIITKRSVLHVAAVLDPPLVIKNLRCLLCTETL